MVINDKDKSKIDWYCNQILKNKSQYQAVESSSNVPWYVVGITHGLEASFDFDSCLHNGQPWNKITTMVPRGRGPWKSWIDAAVDAVKYDKLNEIEFDCIEKCLFAFEKYNGFGYEMRGKPSPYLYAGSNQYVSGKFIEMPFFPSYYSESTVSKQIGAAVILKKLIMAGEVSFDKTVMHEPIEKSSDEKPMNQNDTAMSFIDTVWKFICSLF